MKNETELADELRKTTELLEKEDTELGRANIVLEHFARLTTSEPKKLVQDLMLRMRQDISPNDKDPMFIKGMKEGILFARSAMDESDVVSLKLVEQLGVAHATLTKIENEYTA